MTKREHPDRIMQIARERFAQGVGEKTVHPSTWIGFDILFAPVAAEERVQRTWHLQGEAMLAKVERFGELASERAREDVVTVSALRDGYLEAGRRGLLSIFCPDWPDVLSPSDEARRDQVA